MDWNAQSQALVKGLAQPTLSGDGVAQQQKDVASLSPAPLFIAIYFDRQSN